jgi:hypothetical protein
MTERQILLIERELWLQRVVIIELTIIIAILITVITMRPIVSADSSAEDSV